MPPNHQTIATCYYALLQCLALGAITLNQMNLNHKDASHTETRPTHSDVQCTVFAGIYAHLSQNEGEKLISPAKATMLPHTAVVATQHLMLSQM